MKKLILTIALVLVSTFCFSQQSFNIGVVSAGGTFAKLNGNINIDTKNVSIETSFNGKNDKLLYDLIKEVNHNIYFTDGVKTFSFNVIEQVGKQKGFEYNSILVLNFDGQSVMYYCNKLI